MIMTFFHFFTFTVMQEGMLLRHALLHCPCLLAQTIQETLRGAVLVVCFTFSLIIYRNRKIINSIVKYFFTF